MKKVSTPKVVTALEATESPLPPAIQEALGELVGAAREGLLALSVGVELGVVHELMEAEVTEIVGPKGKHNADRVAKRHGHEDGSMTLGGRRVAVSRPRMRSADDEHELAVQTYGYFADRDPLTRAVMDRMLAGVSTRKFARVGEPVGREVQDAASATGKSTVSELFVRADPYRAGRADEPPAGRRQAGGDDARRPADRRPHARRRAGHQHRRGEDPARALGRLDGERHARTNAAGRSGRPRPGPRAGDPVRHRRRQGAAQGDQGRLRRARARASLPSSQGTQRLRSAARARPRPALARIRAAWALTDAELAQQRLQLLASELDRTWPDAAASLREGMHDTLTLMRLGIAGQLAKTLSSTNPCESMIEIVRYTQRNVKCWQDGDMRKRWTAAGMLVAEQQFRRIIGYRDLADLVIAIERHAMRVTATEPAAHAVAEPVTV